MKIEVRQTHPWTVVGLRGSLGAESSPAVYLEFRRELLQGRTRFLFDLSGVSRVDDEGLGTLVRCFKEARLKGGLVGLVDVPEPIRRILEFTRLDRIFLMAEAPLAGVPAVETPLPEAA